MIYHHIGLNPPSVRNSALMPRRHKNRSVGLNLLEYFGISTNRVEQTLLHRWYNCKNTGPLQIIWIQPCTNVFKSNDILSCCKGACEWFRCVCPTNSPWLLMSSTWTSLWWKGSCIIIARLKDLKRVYNLFRDTTGIVMISLFVVANICVISVKNVFCLPNSLIDKSFH